ncbi:MAG: ComF family protein [bacterium]|nr:ComF family protein [bacterium]
MHYSSLFSSVFKKVQDTLIPPLCLKCYRVVEEEQGLCPSCWQKLRFLTDPLCHQCGFPFDFSEPLREEESVGISCGSCLANPPPFQKHRSAVAYDGESSSLIMRFKHGDCLASSGPMAQWMHRAGKELIDQCDVLVPVPLHRWRLWKRRYNQASVLAQKISEVSNVPLLDGVLVRRKSTQSQGHLTFGARQKNVKGVFDVTDLGRQSLKDKNVLLIDDVFTTGATLAECAKALNKAGVGSVDALTLARVVMPGKGRRI